MAKGRGGGRPGGRKGGVQGPQVGGRKRGGGGGRGAPAEQELPTAAPGSHGLPASIMGGRVSVDLSRAGTRAVQRPDVRRRNRGGPRPEAERIARGPKVVHDFRYVRADLQWIAITSAASISAVIVAWLALRA